LEHKERKNIKNQLEPNGKENNWNIIKLKNGKNKQRKQEKKER
jgi:hypothetical protein